MVIKHGLVFQPDGSFAKKDVFIAGERIAENSQDETVVDAKGCYVIPGLIDVHFHGCVGHDFCDGSKESIAAMAKYELENGITSICPASMTLGEDVLMNIVQAAAAYKEAGRAGGAELVGINMEGPLFPWRKKALRIPNILQKRTQRCSAGCRRHPEDWFGCVRWRRKKQGLWNLLMPAKMRW